MEGFTPSCPECGHSVPAYAEACAVCGLSLDALDAVFGAVPAHRGKINDYVAAFSKSDLSKLSAALRQMHERFPQSTFAIFTTKTAPDRMLLTQAFWLFNRAKICAPASKLGRNFSVLLLISPLTAQAAITVGYGLERLLSKQDLHHILEAGRQDFSRMEFGRGCLKILARLSEAMRAASVRSRQQS